jgi:signal transduction histidine kinase/DNA-binding response OmpR family regulator
MGRSLSMVQRVLRFPKSMRRPGLILLVTILCVQFLFAQHTNVDSLKQLLTEHHGVDRILTLNALASAQENTEINSAFEYAAEAFRLAQEINDSKHIIISEYQLGILHAQKKDDTLSIQHLRHAINLALSIEDPYLISVGYLKLSRYYMGVHDYRKSIAYLNHALNIAEAHNFKGQTAEAYTRLGSSYKSLANYKNALDNYLKALRIYEVSNDRAAIAKTLNDIGTVYQRTDDFEDALDYFNRALKINEAIHNAEAIADNLLNIGVIYQKKGLYDDALQYYNTVLPVMKELKDLYGEAIVTGNIGSTMVEQGKLAEGLAYLEKALVLKEKVNIPRSILHTMNDIADVKIKLQDPQGAKEIAKNVVAMALKYHEADQLRYGYLNLSKSYQLAKDYEHAYHFLKKHNTINDSLFNIQKAHQIRELEIQYDTEKKDMAINALQQEKEIANAQRKVYILIGTIILLVLAGLYLSQRLKTKRNRLLLEKEREVDRLKSDFFANISHEFRTPLSLILGPIETLLSKINEEDHRFQLGLMKKSASRLLRLITQILDLSKLQFGKFELKVTKLNAVEWVRGVSATFESVLEAKDIRLDFTGSDEEITLFADREQLETICINLISNAIKFTGAGGQITVYVNKINAQFSECPEGELELVVKDNGVGIPADKLDHIFDRFYSAGSASEKNYGGTGIGLALTKELVELHKGNIQVTSELMRGTTVTVHLPLGKAHFHSHEIIQPVDQTMEGQDPTDHFSSRMLFSDSPGDDIEGTEELVEEKPVLLIIEDNVDVRNYLKSILDTNYTLVQAINGEDGVSQAKSVIPDLIISDVIMPKMNGYEACRRLKKDEKTSHIPVILLTAKASVESRIEGLETQADLYLNKPFLPRELLLCINNLIESRKKLRERYNRQMVLKPSDVAVNSMDELFLQRLVKVVEANFEDENFTVEQLSAEMAMSRSQLHRKLQALTNESCSQFIRTFRLQRAMELLKRKHASVSEIAFKVGFASPSYFNKCFIQQYGCVPSSVSEGVATDSN